MNCGYPLEWFAEPVDEYLVCGICNKVLQNPRATSCGHVFCHDCLQSWTEYYGVCPNRCGEIELLQVTRPLHIEKRISGLFVRCKYVRLGCRRKLPLEDKWRHEKGCSYRSREQRFEARRRHSAEDNDFVKHFKRMTTSTIASSLATLSTAVVNNTMQSQHTYRLKRNRQKEPLGLVVVSGSKTEDGRPADFFVKKVNPGTPASRAGLQAGDRIVQIDQFDLWKISTKEAVARIKDNSLVTLTVLRSENLRHDLPSGLEEEHIYDEILYADLSQPQFSQPDENFPPFGGMSHQSPFATRRNRPPMNEDFQNRPMRMVRPISPSATYMYKTTTPTVPSSQAHKTPSGEKGSKDSGLSSGSSGSPRMGTVQVANSSSNLDRSTAARHSHRTEREMLRTHSQSQKGVYGTGQAAPGVFGTGQPAPGVYGTGQPAPVSARGRIEGDYEIEDIYMEKNGTSQLGLTLGYDTKYSQGRLYICEILPTGLAAKDGRLQTGDIIQRVNGFEVYDAEEAVLMFLEQDQDITLTVARRIKNTRPNQLAVASYSHRGRPRSFDNLESTVQDSDGNLRKVDSCGSLDSHMYRCNEPDTSMAQGDSRNPQCRLKSGREDMLEVDDGEYEPMSSPVRQRKAMAHGRNVSPPFLPQPPGMVATPPSIDHAFRPVSVRDQRPRTAGPFKNHRHERQTSPQPRSPVPRKIIRPSSATPESSRRIHHQPPRQFSVGSADLFSPRSLPPRTFHTDNVYSKARAESLV